MELLTGKAKTDFYNWKQAKGIKWNPTQYSLDLAELIYYTTIKEWLESVSIIINDWSLHRVGSGYDIDTINKEYSNEKPHYKTRTEALKNAIIKAKELYNNNLTV